MGSRVSKSAKSTKFKFVNKIKKMQPAQLEDITVKHKHILPYLNFV